MTSSQSARPPRAWTRFWFTPVDPIGLRGLRVLVGLLLLGWLLSFAGNVEALFGPAGWFDREAHDEVTRLAEGSLPTGWSLLPPANWDPRWLTIGYAGALVVLGLFTLGVAVRVTAVLTWVLVASFTANPILDTDTPALLHVLAFYLMIGCVLTGRGRRPSVGANVAVRLLQIHLAVLVAVSGLHKLQFGDWWAGVAFWYPLHPALTTRWATARAHAADVETYLGVLSLAAYLTLAWQIGFPLFAWRRRWRLVVIAGAAVGWVGSSWLYRVPWFGPALFIGCSSYLDPEQWRALVGLPGRLLARRRPEVAVQPLPVAGPKGPRVGQAISSPAAVGHNG
jgi:hypothetical protein